MKPEGPAASAPAHGARGARLDDAWMAFDAGDFDAARRLALRRLVQRPRDPDALRVMQALRERVG